MELLNDTEDVAGLLRCDRPHDEMAAALIVRRRFRVLPDGTLEAPGPADLLQSLRMEPVDEAEYGLIPPDDFYPRRGTDVIILGDAVCPEARVATRVAVKVGPYDVSLDVYGNRVWESVLGSLAPSSPEPFLRMPLIYRNAYGGASPGEYGPVPWHNNPNGKGYVLRQKDVAGTPLPNVESPEHHIKNWDDRPDPVGVGPYPITWGLRAAKCFQFHPEDPSRKFTIHPEEGLFDKAHPLLSGKQVDGGTLVVNGVTERPSLQIELPDCPYEAVITVGEETVVRDLALEEILLDTRKGLLDLTYRKMFRYPLWAQEFRHALLRSKTANGRPLVARGP
jgi:hypothetical protein